MSTVAEVKLWGRTVGAIALEEGQAAAAFEYDPAFAGSGIEVAPLTMPLSNRVYFFPELSRVTFHGLPGLLADSLPDRFGNALINAWLATRGRTPESFNAVERLCYTGKRGMGALEFEPTIGPKARRATRIQVDKLVELASEILTNRENLKVSFTAPKKEQALREILKVGTSAGGARAKAVIAWNPSTNEVLSGQIPAGEGYEYWLLKFDGVKGNRDKELEDPKGYGVIEYAYYNMACDAKITMSDMTYSFNPSGKWTASHQMTVNGKRDNFTMEDFKACAKIASMKRGRAETIVNEVLEAVSRWRDYADQAGVSPSMRDQIQHALRLKGF